MDVGEAELAALVAEGEAFVIDAEEVEDGGVEVVDVDGVFGDGVAEFVGLAVGRNIAEIDAGSSGITFTKESGRR